jgi:steroid 5-alpha reductase family enzyme
LPITTAAGSIVPDRVWLTSTGVVFWTFGFIFESIADRQLARFVGNKANKGKVLSTGLWRFSRHPNYFGELVQWWAIGIIALQTAHGWIGLLGPALLTFLIVFVSGIPPIENRRKDNAAYQAYKKRTSPLIPQIPRSS